MGKLEEGEGSRSGGRVQRTDAGSLRSWVLRIGLPEMTFVSSSEGSEGQRTHMLGQSILGKEQLVRNLNKSSLKLKPKGRGLCD